MKIQHLEISMVAAARDCNPTIINPDFLELREIVPKSWGWKRTGSPITTPPFAKVEYDSKVSIIVEASRFQVLKEIEGEEGIVLNADFIEESKIPYIASKYIEVLPHVRYIGAGHNFKSFVPRENPVHFIKERFLKKGEWDSHENPLEVAALKFIYHTNDGIMTISIEKASLSYRNKEEPAVDGLIIIANVHRECSEYPGDELIKKYFTYVKSDWDAYITALKKIIGSEG